MSKNADGLANSVDWPSDQTAPNEQADLGLFCLLSSVCYNTQTHIQCQYGMMDVWLVILCHFQECLSHIGIMAGL